MTKPIYLIIMKKILLTSVILSILTACTTLPPLSTPSGKPEITIVKEKKEAAENQLINKMISFNYSLENQTPHSITFSRSLSGWEATATLIGIGNSYSSNPMRHAQFSFITINDKCRIILSRYWATCENVGGRTGSMEVTNKSFLHGFQNDLENIKSRL